MLRFSFNSSVSRIILVGLVLLLSIAPLAGIVSAQGGGTHTVRQGESLGIIAQRYGVSTTALANANGIANPNLIYAGQVLVIPGGSGGGSVPVTVAGGIYGTTTTPNAYLDENATYFVGVIPRGTGFTALARKVGAQSHMMVVQGEGFVVWVAYPWTTISQAQYLGLPYARDVYLPQLLCVAAFCAQTITGGNPIGGPITVPSTIPGVSVPSLTAPTSFDGMGGGALPSSQLQYVENSHVRILFNEDNVDEGWAEFRLELCDAPESTVSCEAVLRLYEFGQLVPPLRIDTDGHPVWRMSYHLHSTVRMESSRYYANQLWVSHPYDDRSD